MKNQALGEQGGRDEIYPMICGRGLARFHQVISEDGNYHPTRIQNAKGFFSSTIGWFVLGYSQLPLVYHLPKYHQPFTTYHWCIIYPNTIRFDYVRLFIYHWFQQPALFIHHKPLVNKSLFPPLPSGNHPWVAGKSTV